MDREARDLFERSIAAATRAHSGAALDGVLADLGWHDALASSPRDAITILFERQGADCVSSTALDSVLLDALGVTADRVVLPGLGRWEAGQTTAAVATLDGLALGRAERFAVVAHHDGTDVAVVVPRDRLALRDGHGIDPSVGIVRVQGEVDVAAGEPVAWADAVVRGQRALAHELIGASRTMLDLARQHAVDRIQFGRPIATFQAVRHRLAETLVAIETAVAGVDAAWIDVTPVNAAMAKALAGRGARVTARHCQQVLAGIGFTTEHPLHRSVRRVLLLDQLLGSSTALTRELGARLAGDRRLPPPLAL